MNELLNELLQEEEDTQKGKHLTFLIGKELYGLEIKYVTEIIGLQPITQIPELDSYMKGIINLRGKIIPVMDVRLKFRKEEKEYNDRTCIVVIDIKEMSIGLIVDNVSEVMSITDDNISLPPDSRTGFHNRYIKGIGKMGNEVVLLLDAQKLLSSDELDKIEGSL